MEDYNLDLLIKENAELIESLNKLENKNRILTEKKICMNENNNFSDNNLKKIPMIKNLKKEISILKQSNNDLISKISDLESKFLSIAQNKLVPDLKSNNVIKFKTNKGDFYLNKIDITMLSEFLNSTVVFSINQKNSEIELNKSLIEKFIFMLKYIENKR